MLSGRPRLVRDTVKGDLTDGEVVVSRSGGQRALILNEMADIVLDLCDGSRTVAEIAAFVRQTLRVPATVDVDRDIDALLDELVRAGVVETVE